MILDRLANLAKYENNDQTCNKAYVVTKLTHKPRSFVAEPGGDAKIIQQQHSFRQFDFALVSQSFDVR